jgi:hypothetical protein
MKRYSIFFLVLISNYLIFSQNKQSAELQNFAPKSPEAAAFLKYGEYPVNLSTGVPNISIPIHTINAGSFQLPISLNYHASGIKVAQEATWVGLGWNLNAGAQIILSVRDDIDENNPYIDDIPNADAIYKYWDSHPYQFNGGVFTSQHLNYSRVKDVYTFSSPTSNGDFYIRNFLKNDVVIFPPDAFKVELLGTSRQNMNFKITDASGNVYLFNNSKETSVGALTHGDTYTSAWFVDEIETSTHDKINFVYQSDGALNDVSSTQRVDITEKCETCGACGGLQSYSVSPVIEQGSTTITTIKKIKEIIYDQGQSKVVFEKKDERQDLINGNGYLNKIEIQHLKNDVFKTINGYSFEYSYFNSTNSTSSFDYKNKRLKLNKVLSLIEGEGHEFVYSNNELPGKTSKAQDYYGYYNGQNNSSDMIPTLFISPPHSVQVGNGLRDVSTNYIQAGILKEVHYPTKGWTKFNYENNEYFGIDDFEKYKLKTVNSHSVQGTGLASSPPQESPGIDEFIPICKASNPINCVNYVIVPFEAVNATGQLVFQMLNSGSSDVTVTKNKYCRVSVHVNGNTIYNSGKLKSNDQYKIPLTSFQSGIILIEAYGQQMSIEGLVLKYVNNSNIPKNNIGSGLRIQSIENYNHNNKMILKKQYDYSDIADNKKSSGKLINRLSTSFVSNGFTNFNLFGCPGVLYPSVAYQNTYSVSSNSRYGIEGNSVTYKYVREYYIDPLNNTKNGYISYEFTTDSDEIPLGNPSVQIHTSWKRGKILEKKYYKTIGNLNYILKKENNIYVEDNSKISYINGFKMYKICNINENEDPANPLQAPALLSRMRAEYGLPSNVAATAELVTYNLSIPWFYQKSIETTDYFYDSNNVLKGSNTSITNYFYDNPNHLQLTRTEMTNSNNEVLKTINYYPNDLLDSPYMSNLISQNRIAEIIKTENYNGTNLMSTQNKVFKDWGNDVFLPEIIQTSVGNRNLENRIRYNLIDNTNGKPIEMQMENGLPVVYIWGYNKTQPIAKIENARYTEIETLLGAGFEIPEGLTPSQEATLRSGLPNAMITTYTYKPLVGVSTMTDPKGYKMTYEYDSSNRLIHVKDHEGNVLSENQYNYKQ